MIRISNPNAEISMWSIYEAIQCCKECDKGNLKFNVTIKFLQISPPFFYPRI